MEQQYLEHTNRIMEKHLLLDELSKWHFEDEDSLPSYYSYKIAAQKLLRVIRHRSEDEMYLFFLTKNENNQMVNACTFCKVLMDWKFQYNYFYEHLCAHPYMPLEFIWNLHILGIISLDSYLQIISTKPESVSVLCKCVVQLAVTEVQDVESHNSVAEGILAYFVQQVFSNNLQGDNEKDSKIKMICQITINSCLKRITSIIEKENEYKKPVLLTLLWNARLLDKTACYSFSIFSLDFILKYNPTVNVFQAISKHHKWTYKTCPFAFISVLEKLLKTINAEDISSLIYKNIKANKVNWQNLSVVVTVYINLMDEALTNFQMMIEKLLNEAVNNNNEDLLCSCFALSRQITLESTSVSYCSWFQRYFGDPATTCLNTTNSFEFFIRVLTSLVPYEQEQYLKIHINFPPYVIPKCRNLFSAYVSLAKTRLSDLKPKLEPAVVIEHLLESYETSGKIPSAILEASVFHKHHFLSELLPALLTPRVLPDMPDSRLKLINELNSLGKIPKDMFDKYSDACYHETKKIMDAVIDEDVIMEEETVNEKITKLLSSFEKLLQRNAGYKFMEDHLFNMQRSLSELLKELCGNKCKRETVILLDDGEVNASKEVITKILKCYCIFYRTFASTGNTVPWNLIDNLFNFPCLLEICHRLLWQMLTQSAISDADLGGLVICVLHSSMKNIHCWAISNSSGTHSTLAEQVLDYLSITDSKSIDYFYRCSCICLKYALQVTKISSQVPDSVLPSFVPSCLIKKFRFVAVRCNPLLRGLSATNNSSAHLHASCVKVYKADVTQKWFLLANISLTEWLQYEAAIIPENDHLENEARLNYMYWCLHHLYCVQNDFAQTELEICKYAYKCFLNILLSKPKQCPSYLQLLSLLKMYIEKSALNFSDHCPWVFEKTYEIIEKIEKNSNVYNLLVLATLRKWLNLVCHLPSYLLFGCSPCQKNYNSGLEELMKFINNWLTLYHDETFFLMQEFVLQITEGLLLILHQNQMAVSKEMVDKLILKCPLFICSLIRHWPFVEKNIFKLSEQNNHFALYLTAVQNIMSTTLLNMKDNIPITFSSKILDRWVMGFVFMEQMKKHNYDMQYLKVQNSEVLGAALGFYIMFRIALTPNEQGFSSSNVNIIQGIKLLIYSQNVKYLKPKCYSNSVLKEIICSSAWYHYSAGCLRILLQLFSKDDLKKLEKQTLLTWLILLFENLGECNKHFDSRSPVSFYFYQLTSEAKYQKRKYGVLDFHFIQESTAQIKDMLNMLPCSILQELPEDVIEECDDYNKCYIRSGRRKQSIT